MRNEKMNAFHGLCPPEYELVDQKYEISRNESYSACMAVVDLWGFFPKVVANIWNPTNILSFFSSSSFLFW